MPLSTHTISVKKTARYFVSGGDLKEAKSVWIIIHGYAQKAEDFIKNFDWLKEDEDYYIIAPEALNRFYLKGGFSETGATWMTKEDRENEINDYICYLNDLYDLVSKEFNEDCKIHVLGFSQGATTVSRWLYNNVRKVDTMILYAGEIAAELRSKEHLVRFYANRKVALFGSEDKIIPIEIVRDVEPMLIQNGFEVSIYKGGHTIIKDAVLSTFSL
jgi:predicted esterase